MSTGENGAISLLALLIASIRDEVGAAEITGTANGVAATLVLPSGDRYRVTVDWLGDNEAAV